MAARAFSGMIVQVFVDVPVSLFDTAYGTFAGITALSPGKESEENDAGFLSYWKSVRNTKSRVTSGRGRLSE